MDIGISLEAVSFEELERRQGQGELTSVDLTAASIERIEAENPSGQRGHRGEPGCHGHRRGIG